MTCSKCQSDKNGFNKDSRSGKPLTICKKCRNADGRKYKKTHLHSVVQQEKLRLLKNPKKKILANARKRAKQKGFLINISDEDIMIPEVCPVLGIKLVFSNKQTPNSPSIDRIDNSKGYVRGNIQIISWRANNLKADGTLDEFEAIVRHLRQVRL